MASRPTGNVCFELLDRPVVAGRSDETAFGDVSFARLLEDVAAFAGVLLAVGAGPGERVLVDLGQDHDAVVIALATARLGAVLVVGPDAEPQVRTLVEGATPVAVVTDRPERYRDLGHRPGTLLVRGDHGPLDERHELAWAIAERAGRSDPAPSVEVPVGSAYALSWTGDQPAIRSVEDQLAAVAAGRPQDLAAWRALLLG